MQYPGLDPAIAAALMARQHTYSSPGFEGSLPAPGGPVDIGIDQAAQAARGITPLPRPGVTYPHVLGVGRQNPVLPPELMARALQMYQARKQAQVPGMNRMQAVQQAHQQAAQHLTRIQHQRRANGPYR